MLDGATDPLIRSADGCVEDGFPYYAADGIPGAIQRFSELCDASDRCVLGADSEAVPDELVARIGALPADDFAGSPDVVDDDAYVELIASSMSYSGDWELLATGVADASEGDASALASLISTDAAIRSNALDETAEPFEIANIVIYCADFRHVIDDWSYCDSIPVNEEMLVLVEAIEVATAILVIGTEFDPLTPGQHAPVSTEALENAVDIVWNGVGHTAFSAPTDCINDAVARQLLDGV